MGAVEPGLSETPDGYGGVDCQNRMKEGCLRLVRFRARMRTYTEAVNNFFSCNNRRDYAKFKGLEPLFSSQFSSAIRNYETLNILQNWVFQERLADILHHEFPFLTTINNNNRAWSHQCVHFMDEVVNISRL